MPEPEWQEFITNHTSAPVARITLCSVTPLDSADFFARMQGSMAVRDRKEVFAFIHGHNVAFNAAAR